MTEHDIELLNEGSWGQCSAAEKQALIRQVDALVNEANHLLDEVFGPIEPGHIMVTQGMEEGISYASSAWHKKVIGVFENIFGTDQSNVQSTFHWTFVDNPYAQYLVTRGTWDKKRSIVKAFKEDLEKL